MSPLSRRGFLAAAASVGVLAPAAGAAAATPATPAPGRPAQPYAPPPEAAAAPAACAPSAAAPGVMQATGTLGTVAATVHVRVLKDVVALRYRLTNSGDTQNTYTVSYTDQVSTVSSRAIDCTVDPGQGFQGVLYGSLDHEFLFYVDLPDGTTLTLGPLNRLPSCTLSRRKPPKPIYQPPKHHHG